MLAKVFKKEIEVDSRLPGKCIIKVELDKYPDDPENHTIAITSYSNDKMDEPVIAAKCGVDELDGTLKQVSQSHLHHLFELEKEDLQKFLINRGFITIRSTIIT